VKKKDIDKLNIQGKSGLANKDEMEDDFNDQRVYLSN
jgi:hypothetical protein